MRIAILFAALALATGAAPHPDVAAVQASVAGFFAALHDKSRAGFESVTLPDASFISLRQSAEGWTRTRRDRDTLVKSLVDVPGVIVERFLVPPMVRLHGPSATVWGRYDLSIDGKRQHCGVDVFELVKDGDRWLISNASWTIEPQGCAQ